MSDGTPTSALAAFSVACVPEHAALPAALPARTWTHRVVVAP
jgi:hypothetical protein